MQALAYLQFSSPVHVASMPGAQPGPFASGSDGGMAAGSHMVAESSVCIKGAQLLNGSVWSFPMLDIILNRTSLQLCRAAC